MTPFLCQLILAFAVLPSAVSQCLTLIGTRLRKHAKGMGCMGPEARAPLAILVLPLHLVPHLERGEIIVTPLQGRHSRAMMKHNTGKQDQVQILICQPDTRQIMSTPIVIL